MHRLKLDALNLPTLEQATQHRKPPLYVPLAYSQSLIVSVGLGSEAHRDFLSVRCVPILLKNSLIWMQSFSAENQTARNFTYK